MSFCYLYFANAKILFSSFRSMFWAKDLHLLIYYGLFLKKKPLLDCQQGLFRIVCYINILMRARESLLIEHIALVLNACFFEQILDEA